MAFQRFALPALGRAGERRPTGKMLRRRKMLGIAPESPASGARFVGHFRIAQDSPPKKDIVTNLVELSHITYSLAIDSIFLDS